MSARIWMAAALALSVAALCGAADYDYGGSFDSESTYGDRPSTTADEWEQRLKTALWLAVDFAARVTLDAQVSYLYTLDRPYLIDLDLLRLSGTVPLPAGGAVSYQAGRLVLADATGLILNHLADGLLATAALPALRVTASAGYTGLLLKPEANVNMSAADLADDGDDDVILAPRRLVGGLEVALPEIWGRQTPALFVIAQFDLREDEAGRIDTQYSGLRLSGPLAASVYYDGAVVIGTGEGLLTALGTAGLRYYNPALRFTRVEVRGLYASGASDSLDPFLPVSAPSLATVFSPTVADLIGAEASYSLKPLAGGGGVRDDFQLSVRALALMTAVDAAYAGTVIEAGINFRPFSDLGASLNGGLWLPDGGDTEYAVKLQVSVAF